MALTVGELTAIITVDMSGVDRGLQAAQGSMRAAGAQMTGTADRSGRAAGDALGDGVVQGADGRLRDLRGRFVRAGRAAGDGLGDALEQSAEQGTGEAVQGMEGKMAALPMVAAGIGMAAGAALMTSFQGAMDQGKLVGRLQAQLGATPAEAKRYGTIAGKLYTGAIADTFEEGTQAIRHAMQAGLIPPDATNKQIESISRKVMDLSKTFDVDLGESAMAVGQMIRTGLVKNASQGLDLIGRAFQVNDLRADDMLDTLKEYPVQFRDLGIDGAAALGIIQQGLDGGAKDTDIVADALKELNIRVKDLSAADGLKKLKIDANEAAAAFAEGGPKAANMLDKITDRLRGVTDKSERYRIAQEVLGTQSEDLAGALMAIDPSEADKRLGKFKGTVDAAGNALRDNAGTKVDQFKRGLQQGVVDFLGGTVLPAVEKARTFIVSRFGSMWAEAGEGGTTGVDRVLAFVGILGERVVMKIRELAPRAIQGLIGLGQDLANWMIANPTTVFKVAALATAIMVGFAMLPFLVGAALLAAANTIVASFVTRMVTGAQTKLGQLGTSIGGWFSRLWSTYLATPVSNVWNLFITSVRGLPGRAVAALNILGSRLSGVATRAWTDFKAAASRKQAEFITWVNGIPGRITRAIGSLDDLLYDKGRDLIRGLVSGVKSMGGWLADQLTSFARSKIPGPIAKALGISSPSKVMAREVGRWIPAGIAKGVQANSGVVDRTMSSLVDTPTPSAAMAGAMGGSSTRSTASSSGSKGPLPRLTFGDSAFDEFLLGRIRQAVGTRGGDVQLVLSGRR